MVAAPVAPSCRSLTAAAPHSELSNAEVAPHTGLHWEALVKAELQWCLWHFTFSSPPFSSLHLPNSTSSSLLLPKKLELSRHNLGTALTLASLPSCQLPDLSPPEATSHISPDELSTTFYMDEGTRTTPSNVPITMKFGKKYSLRVRESSWPCRWLTRAF